MLTINMDDEVKKEFTQIVNDMGMNITTAVNLFARAVIREKGIPFPVTLRTKEEQDWNDYLNDQFRRGLEDLAAGKTCTVEEAKRMIAERKGL